MPLLSRRTAAQKSSLRSPQALRGKALRGIRFHARRAAAPSRSPAPAQAGAVRLKFFDTLNSRPTPGRLFLIQGRPQHREEAYEPFCNQSAILPGRRTGGREKGAQAKAKRPVPQETMRDGLYANKAWWYNQKLQIRRNDMLNQEGFDLWADGYDMGGWL